MKKKILIFIIILFNILLLSYCLKEVYLSKTIRIIDLNGNNKYWKAYININLAYDAELNIYPFRDDFNIPSIIDIDLIVDNKTVYSNKLEYIKDKNDYFGKYILDLKSKDYFSYKTKEVILHIKYNNEVSEIILNDIQIYK